MTADESFEKHPELKKKFDDEIRNDYYGYWLQVWHKVMNFLVVQCIMVAEFKKNTPKWFPYDLDIRVFL